MNRSRDEHAVPDPTASLPESASRRIWIQRVEPTVDGGNFPAKRTVGETVRVCALIFCDGHDRVGGMLRWRPVSSDTWREIPLIPRGNDEWTAEFTIETLEPHEFTVTAWIDHFATWRQALAKKVDAEQEVQSELLEGAALVNAAAGRASGPDAERLREAGTILGDRRPEPERVEAALDPELAERMARWPDRTREADPGRVFALDVNRERARYGAWYEMFPRSAGGSETRSGTFRDAEAELPRIAHLGFDVVYLPPIHPIGTTHRKGRNNALAADSGDPGSPWAIGSEAGGHTAVHPELGSLEDFERFVEQARQHDLEVALDIAFQCSPDHPWVKEHPEWFRHRPDGTIKFAENPPKQYQDILPLEFENEDWRELWRALLEVVLFWCGRGVRIFRIDNPHTKPLRFWGWLIGQVKERYPGSIFLSEAFTRPNVMYSLAKVGFDQSYTYFTWRNTKDEITRYFTDLTATGVREFFRPNLFANTPDILPEYLQFGGRPAFLARAAIAATLGASWGIYSGFELCEGEAIPGTEEYLDSEKYQFRSRDWNRPGNINEFIRKLNRIRRENPPLRSNERLRFHATDNEQILCYSKSTRDLSHVVLVVVNVDPHHVQDGWIEVPLEELGIRDQDTFQAHDLLGEGRYLWHGPRNYVRLDPQSSPAQVFRLRRRVRTERDFDYFL